MRVILHYDNAVLPAVPNDVLQWLNERVDTIALTADYESIYFLRATSRMQSFVYTEHVALVRGSVFISGNALAASDWKQENEKNGLAIYLNPSATADEANLCIDGRYTVRMCPDWWWVASYIENRLIAIRKAAAAAEAAA